MDLRGGSLLRADGGYLIMYSLEAISEPGVWRALKRTLNHNRLEIQPVDMFYPFGVSGIKPEPIQISVKVILIGDREMYELLYDYEDDFKKIFKVRVELDEEMNWSDEVYRHYGARIRKLVDDEKLQHFDRSAVASILEHGVRLAGRRGKITTRFFDLADLARESCYEARHAGCSVVNAGHVRAALDAKIDRHNLLETKIREMIEQLLFTNPGERVNRQNFGSGLMQIVFAPNSDQLAAATQFLVQGGLQQWLGDLIQVTSVDVQGQDSTLTVTVQYVVRAEQMTQVAQFSRGI